MNNNTIDLITKASSFMCEKGKERGEKTESTVGKSGCGGIGLRSSNGAGFPVRAPQGSGASRVRRPFISAAQAQGFHGLSAHQTGIRSSSGTNPVIHSRFLAPG